jgi:hypothetical protein
MLKLKDVASAWKKSLTVGSWTVAITGKMLTMLECTGVA